MTSAALAASQQSISPLAIYFIFAWTTIWKGLGLWHASKQNQRNWFIAMVVASQ